MSAARRIRHNNAERLFVATTVIMIQMYINIFGNNFSCISTEYIYACLDTQMTCPKCFIMSQAVIIFKLFAGRMLISLSEMYEVMSRGLCFASHKSAVLVVRMKQIILIARVNCLETFCWQQQSAAEKPRDLVQN